MTEIIILATSQPRRDELSRLLNAEPSMRIVGTAASFPVVRSLMETTNADAAVVEIDLSADSQFTRDWLIDILDRIPTVVLSTVADAAIFDAIIRSERGAMLRIDASPEQLIQATRSVSAGLLIFDSALTSQRDLPSDPLEGLTTRETEVLSLLAEGLGNREIATRLSISEHTIKFHIRSILAKLGASSRTEAVTRGLRYGLIEL